MIYQQNGSKKAYLSYNEQTKRPEFSNTATRWIISKASSDYVTIAHKKTRLMLEFKEPDMKIMYTDKNSIPPFGLLLNKNPTGTIMFRINDNGISSSITNEALKVLDDAKRLMYESNNRLYRMLTEKEIKDNREWISKLPLAKSAPDLIDDSHSRFEFGKPPIGGGRMVSKPRQHGSELVSLHIIKVRWEVVRRML